MTTWQSDPEAAVAELIASLPDDFGSLTFPQLRAVGEAHGHIAEAYVAAAHAQRSVLDRVVARGCPPDAPFGEHATEAEAAEMHAALRRSMSAERADAALNAWERRAGAPRYGLGGGLPVEPGFIEMPDGTLAVRVPASGEEER